MYCFDKKRRLLNKVEFDAVFQSGRKIVTPYFIILCSTSTKQYSRLGMALSKKMLSKAHDRNRIKRLLRETFRIYSRTKSITPGMPTFDIVVLARSGLARIDNALIITSLEETWKKLVLTHKN